MKKNTLRIQGRRIFAFLPLLTLLLVFLPAAPAYATAAPENAAGGTMSVEYRYTEGETPDIQQEITQMGLVYTLISQSEPMLESTLPNTRTYRYRIEGALLPWQLEEINKIGNVTLTPVNIVQEREVDKTAEIQMPTNDVDDVPLKMAFEVTSGSSPSGYESKELDRAGVAFSVNGPDEDNLPSGYTATVVYRGIETYAVIGYYLGESTYTTSVQEGGTAAYVIVAEYETAAPIITEPPEPEAEEPEEEPADDVLTRIENQTGNPFTDIAAGNVPLIAPFGVQGIWSFLSLIFAAASILLAAATVLSILARRRRDAGLKELGVYDDDKPFSKHRGGIFRLLTIIFGIVTLLIWLLLDDYYLGIAWINNHTLFVGILFFITIDLFMIARSRERKSIDDENEY
ncbi:MAG: hypothetical protein LBS85_03795 [Clostridiales Family XIII bacterium]|jgi:hypothetical protein|nr:hypothetical protein [Clostridiales Family XIII bacterium]